MPRATKRPRSNRRRNPSTLEAYDKKRDFARTSEPPPGTPPAVDGPLTFVVQKHAARRLHYDFRLELDGVLKSWSVPKGPSRDPKEKRLAVMVEDHPLEYGSYEGVIPKGEYGAGQVIVWDNGSYAPDESAPPSFRDRGVAEERMRADLEKGKLSLTLRGQKLKGSWALVKLQKGEKDWLLIKHSDSAADTETDIVDFDRSVLSGLNIEDLKAGRLPDRANRALPALQPGAAAGAEREDMPTVCKPMMASLAGGPFSDPDWVFEPKLDGIRALCLVSEGSAKLFSRSGLDITAQYPGLAEELAGQPGDSISLDGEIIAPDEHGRPSFELLQQRLNLTREADIRRAEVEVPILYYVFDLLHLDGFDLRSVPLEERISLLERVLLPSQRVRLLERFDASGEVAYAAALELGLEGVVAKRRASIYEPGRRSQQWLKIKVTKSDEFVVGGYTSGQGGRADTFGALVLGQYDDTGSLGYVGNVGSGFDDRTLVELRRRLDKIRRKTSPFSEQPPIKEGVSWVRPSLVAEVKFAERTRDGSLRAPVFLRLRDDKTAKEVQRVDVAATPTRAAAADEAGAADDAIRAPDVAAVLEQLDNDRERFTLRVGEHRLPLTNLNKPLWPARGRRKELTKRDLMVYLAKVSSYMVPHLRDRPLTLTRYPNGIHGKYFFQKHWEHEPPEFVETVDLYSSHNEGDQRYLLCNNLPTLLWLGQLANLEFHTWYSRTSAKPDGGHLSSEFTGSEEHINSSLLNYPDFIVFDLDPYIYSGREGKGDEPELNRKAFAKTCEVALWLKDILDSLSLSSFVKTTGKTGLHIYVPILRQLEYSAVRAACETIGHFLLQQHPRDVTMEWTVEKRTGKVFFDHNQNVRGKTLASVYSPRPAPEGTVSLPLRWDEVGEVYPTEFTMRSAPDRLSEVGDLWEDILDSKHDLEHLLGSDLGD